eukprot:8122944-Alexandrium_andersonii.AAC.1
MSASLVGSEMCIRDRANWPHGPLHGSASASVGAPKLPGQAPAAGAQPVSYTHLTLPTICSV